MNKSAVFAIVFDLGGVLLELRETRSTFDTEHVDADFNEAWLQCNAVRQFERGTTDRPTFARDVVEELRLPYDETAFLEKFEHWPKALYPGVTGMIDAIPGAVQTALLSNTNSLHWNRADIGGVLSPHLDHVFLSYETGELKPDKSAFRRLVDDLACEPDQIVFFDDNQLNVDAAIGMGITALLTRGAAELRQHLERLEMVPAIAR